MNERVSSTLDHRYPVIVARLRMARVDMTKERPLHQCSRTMCDPKNEPDLGIVEPISSNVYVCRHGSIHLCTEDACTLYRDESNGSCPVSGTHYGLPEQSSYDKHDYRTWPATPGAPAKTSIHRTAPEMSEESVREYVLSLVELLLYSNKRARCNEAHQARMKEQSKHATDAYVNERNRVRQLPFMTDVYRVSAQCTSVALPYSILKPYHARNMYYCAVVMHVLSLTKIQRRAHEITVVTMGTLYSMRTGVSYGKDQVLPKDEFLAMYLPLFNDLTAFDVDKTCVTEGMTLVRDAIETTVVADGGATTRVMLDASKLPSVDEVYYAGSRPLLKNAAIEKKKDFV